MQKRFAILLHVGEMEVELPPAVASGNPKVAHMGRQHGNQRPARITVEPVLHSPDILFRELADIRSLGHKPPDEPGFQQRFDLMTRHFADLLLCSLCYLAARDVTGMGQTLPRVRECISYLPLSIQIFDRP